MAINKKQIDEIVLDLKAKRENLENKKPNFNSMPSEHVGVAIYNYVIGQLEGVADETE